MSTLKCERIDGLTQDGFLDLARSRGELLHWDFGPLMEMKYDQAAKNYLFSKGPVPFHWDGAFYKEPEALLFYCTESSGRGGETLFTDTEKIWESLSDSDRDTLRGITLTYRTQKLAHYGGEIRVPVVQTHPRSGKTILRLAERVESELNPVELTIEGAQDSHAFYAWMVSLLYNPRFLTVHAWEKGDLLTCDNFTYLHGRSALGENRSRTFWRIQILKENL